MSYTICRNDILITYSLCFHIVFCVSVACTTPVLELVETVACMFYVVQKTV